MTPQELKESLLWNAIQGNITNQYSNESVDDVIGHITLTSFTNEETYFEIPNNWKWVLIGDIFELVNGKAFKPSDWSDNGIPIVRIQNLNDPNAPYNYCSTPCEEKYHLHGNELLFSWSGTPGTSFGAFIWHGGEAVLNQHIFIIHPRIKADIFYLMYALNAELKIFIEKAHGGAGLKHITRKEFDACYLPIPPLAEQKRIVAKIEELLPLIDRYEKAWSRLEEFNRRFPDDMQKSILQMAIQGKLVEQRLEEGTGEELYQQIQAEKQKLIKEERIKKEKALPEITEEEKPFDIPESWKWAKFLSVVEIATNLVQPNKYQEFKHIAPDNIEKGTGKLFPCRTVAEDKVASANHLFSSGQILYSKIRPLLRKAVIAPFDGLCSADMYPLQTHIESRFLLYFLLSDAFNHQIAEAMSSRVKMPKINQDELSRVYIPLPPLAEQKRIVAKIEELIPLSKHLMIVNNRESL